MELMLNNIPARIFIIIMLFVSLALLGCGGDPASSAPSASSNEEADSTGNVATTDDPSTDTASDNASDPTTEPDSAVSEEPDPLTQPPINPPAIQPAIVEPGETQPTPIPLGGTNETGAVEASAGNPYSSRATDDEETVVGGMSIDTPPPLIAPPIQAEE